MSKYLTNIFVNSTDDDFWIQKEGQLEDSDSEEEVAIFSDHTHSYPKGVWSAAKQDSNYKQLQRLLSIEESTFEDAIEFLGELLDKKEPQHI